MKDSASHAPRTLYQRYHHMPLYMRILAGMVLGVIVGMLLGHYAEIFEVPSKLVLRVLGALASPLILFAVMRALIHAEFPPGAGKRLAFLLCLNTIVAILVGLVVANVLVPGKWRRLELTTHQTAESTPDGENEPASSKSDKPADEHEPKEENGTTPTLSADEAEEQKNIEKIKRAEKSDPGSQILDSVPKSFVGPFGDNGSVIAVIMIAVALGIAIRRMKDDPTVHQVIELLEVGFKVLLQLLHWIVDLIPLAVFGIVASVTGVGGFAKFINLGGFIVAVLVALSLQMIYYLVRIRVVCWASPLYVLKGVRDALVMAFTTGSSTATMPVTYACLREKVGLRERSASLGALVGANFNNDGTALYEAMAALFISQMIGKDLSLVQQAMVVLTSVFASVGAAGIPEAGLVTMTLVFNAVGLPITYIALLIPVDWFLDRCRTAVNVMGDVNVSCMLEGKDREEQHVEDAAAELRNLMDDSGEAIPTVDEPKPLAE